MKIPLILTALLLPCVPYAMAAGESIPQPPLLKRVPAQTQWVITYASHPGERIETVEPLAQKDRGTTIFVVKTPELTLERRVNKEGEKVDTWYAGGNLRATAVNGKNWVVGPPSVSGFNTADYSKEDFAGFGWLSQRNFIGVKTVNGKRCLVFADKVVTVDGSEIDAIKADIDRDLSWLHSGTFDETVAAPVVQKRRTFNIENYKKPVIAYIDEETRLPIALVYKVDGKIMSRVYKFQSTQVVLSLPTDVRGLMEKKIEYNRRLSIGRAPI